MVAGISKGPRGVTKPKVKPRNRKSSASAGAAAALDNADPESEIVYSEPVLVEPGKYDKVLGAQSFLAVDYENTRYSVGDHVALYAGPGKEWVCVIESLYVSPDDGVPTFRGRWYWSMTEVELHRRGRGEKARSSKLPKHELISSDNRDCNPVEVINRRCCILSWKNFRDLYKRNRAACEGVYFCDRMYYHKAFKFQELTHITFPGDAIPSFLRPPPVADCDSLAEQEGDALELRVPRDDDLNITDAHRNPRLVPALPSAATSRDSGAGSTPASEPSTVGNNVSTYFLC
jgi:hypothetical protein